MGTFTLEGCKDSVFSSNDFHTEFLFNATKDDRSKTYTVSLAGIRSKCSNYWLFGQDFSAYFEDAYGRKSYVLNINRYPPEKNTWYAKGGYYVCQGWDPSSGYLTSAHYPAIANVAMEVRANSDGSCPTVKVNFNSYNPQIKHLGNGQWQDAYSYLYNHDISSLIQQHAGKVDVSAPSVSASVSINSNGTASLTVSSGNDTCDWWAYTVYNEGGGVLHEVPIGNSRTTSVTTTIPASYISSGKYYVVGFAQKENNHVTGSSAEQFIDTTAPTISNFNIDYNRLSSDLNSVVANVSFNVNYASFVTFENQSTGQVLFSRNVSSGHHSQQVTLPSAKHTYKLAAARYSTSYSSATKVVDAVIPKLSDLRYTPIQSSKDLTNVGIHFSFNLNTSGTTLVLNDPNGVKTEKPPEHGSTTIQQMGLAATNQVRTLEAVRTATDADNLNTHNASILKTTYSVQCDTTLPSIYIDKYALEGVKAVIEFHTDREVSKAEYAFVSNPLIVNYKEDVVTDNNMKFTAVSMLPTFDTSYQLYVRVKNKSNNFITVKSTNEALKAPPGVYLNNSSGIYPYHIYVGVRDSETKECKWEYCNPHIYDGNNWIKIEGTE